MSIIIENSQSEYLTAAGKWSKDANQGKSYKSKWAAITAGNGDGLSGFNVVLFFPLTNQIVNLDHIGA